MQTFKILFSLVGLAAGLFMTPVPNNPLAFGCTGPLYSPRPGLGDYGARWCEADQAAAFTGAIVGLLAGLALGAFADNVLGKRPQTDVGQSTRASNLTEPAPQANRKQCAHCGAANPAESKFCGTCGSLLITSAPPNQKKCSKCGALNSPEYSFCGDCGTPLMTPTKAEHMSTPLSVAPLVISGGSFLRCPVCNAKNNASAVRCEKCGIGFLT